VFLSKMKKLVLMSANMMSSLLRLNFTRRYINRKKESLEIFPGSLFFLSVWSFMVKRSHLWSSIVIYGQVLSFMVKHSH
jgi:hypothetical protein